MNRETNRKLSILAHAFLDTDYEFRTVGSLCEAMDASPSEVVALADSVGFDTGKTRRSDGKKLVAVGGGYDPELIAAVADALLNEQYQFRTLRAIDSEWDREEVLAFAEALGYDTSKTRRRDGARLIGLTA